MRDVSGAMPLLSVSLSEIQTIARMRLGRDLNLREIQSLVSHLQELIVVRAGWPKLLLECIEEMGMTAKYEQWLKEVGESIWAMAACGVDDLPDFDYYSLFVVGSTPEQAADAILLSMGFSRFE